MDKAIKPADSLTTLITIIKQEILDGKQKIENEKTITYWKIGKHIKQHILEYSDHAEYGKLVFETLSAGLFIGIDTLYRTVQFYEIYLEILAPGRILTWNHYKILLTVKDDKKRKEYELKALEESLSKRELQELIKKDKNGEASHNDSKLKEKRGLPYLYPLKKVGIGETTRLAVDLGFRIYLDVLDNDENYSEESIVQVTKIRQKYRFTIVDNIPVHMLYTFINSFYIQNRFFF